MLLPIVMSGGSGTRLWPLSRSLYPKQFLPLASKLTMLQSTVKRLEHLDAVKPMVICNEEHRFLVAEQLRAIGQLGPIILEPEGRNTAPAIALAAELCQQSVCQQSDSDPLLLVLAADHVIEDDHAFTQSVRQAIPLAEQGKLVTFGITPKSAHTGYGYIKVGSVLSDDSSEGFEVDQFVEKPDKKTAQHYVDSNDYYWNSGMFLFKASCYLQALQQHRSDIAASCHQAIQSKEADNDFVRIDEEVFLQCPSESIDYAVMEQSSNVVVVPMDAGWNDIGAWSSLWDIADKDSNGNVCKGDVISESTHNCLIRADERLVTTIGVENLVIVDTKDAVMVASKDKVQDVKNIVSQLKQAERSEVDLHREVYRPWGKYDSIDNGERYQVKHITVNPGAKLSVQMHHHRAEHWVVVSGTAKVTNGDKTFMLSENESTFIPIGIVHALENPGKVPLELIEVQSGSYLGEDDIVRFEDKYGRVANDS